MERLRKKLAIVSHIVPPSTQGTAMRMSRLLRDIHPDDYCLLIGNGYYEFEGKQSRDGILPAKHFRLPSELKIFELSGSFRLSHIKRFVNIFYQLYQRAKNISLIIRKEKCQAIMAFSGNRFNLPTALFASWWTGVPFYAAIDDYYTYQWPRRLDRLFARFLEPIVLKGASRVMVLNDFLKNEYQRRYRINPIIVYNPNESIPDYAGNDNSPWPYSDNEISIVFTGSIYHANYNAFENVVKAIKLLDRPDVKLHIYTAQTKERLQLEDRGISGPVVFHGYLSPSESLNVQKNADILFLPLGFRTTIPEVIKTSAPFKMAEYMSSGRPILVHAPQDSFLCWYFKKYNCGLVVDVNDPAMLAKEINRIITDKDARRQAAENALARASADFDLKQKQTEFLEFLQPV